MEDLIGGLIGVGVGAVFTFAVTLVKTRSLKKAFRHVVGTIQGLPTDLKEPVQTAVERTGLKLGVENKYVKPIVKAVKDDIRAKEGELKYRTSYPELGLKPPSQR
jgi:hypothetical protein